MVAFGEFRGSALTQQDLDNLERRWIQPELARQMALRRVSSAEAAPILNRSRTRGNYDGILIPNIFPGDSGPRGYRIRRDCPEIESGKDGTRKEMNKYLSAYGDRNMLYFVPGTNPDWLTDPTLPVAITEGEFKCGALFRFARHGISPSNPRPQYLAIALPGVWNFRGKVATTVGPKGEPRDVKGVIPDFDRITWRDRPVYIVFDVNVRTNDAVRSARRKLSYELQDRGAKVLWVDLPEVEGVNGVDDLLARKGVELVLHLFREARPAPAPRRRVSVSGTAANSGEESTSNNQKLTGKVAQYEATSGGLFWWRNRDQDAAPTRLTNFDARIALEIVKDDGLERRRFYEIQTTLDGSASAFQVPAAQFHAMNWPSEHLGGNAIVMPGHAVKEHVAAAIQFLSRPITQRTIYVHTGWCKTGEVAVYLHAGGAIAADGPPPNAQAELLLDLAGYVLPAPPEGEVLRAAFRTSLRLLDAAPLRITAPLFCSVYRAVLGSTNFSIHLVGDKEVGKTSLAALAQQHFGAAMDAEHLPATWLSTGNALGLLAFLVKDAVMVVDDFVPRGTDRDVQRKHADADSLMRGQGNNQGRQRLRADASFMSGRKPRATIISTGEESPRGSSLQARMLILDVGPDIVDWGILGELQNHAQAGTFAAATAAYIRWVAARYEHLQSRMRQELGTARHNRGKRGIHSRGSDIAEQLFFGACVALEFAIDSGAVNEDQADKIRERIKCGLDEASTLQQQQRSEIEPTERFIQLTQAAVATGEAYLAKTDGSPPDNPERWGYRVEQVGVGSHAGPQLRPGQHLIGWVDGPAIYLEPRSAHSVAQVLARKAGEGVLPELGRLASMLRDQNFLVAVDKNRRSPYVRKVCQGRRLSVLYLHDWGLEVVPNSDQSDHEQHG